MTTEQDSQNSSESELPDLPTSLLSRSPLGWISLFGPGAIVASVTIGTGELIFSTRGGVLFGYNILSLFVFISLLKWVLVFGTSKHLLLTGIHPFRRMMDLPGPRGWLLMMLLIMICYKEFSHFMPFTGWMNDQGFVILGSAGIAKTNRLRPLRDQALVKVH